MLLIRLINWNEYYQRKHLKLIVKDNLHIMHHNLNCQKRLTLETKNTDSISVSINERFGCIVLQFLKTQLYNSTITVKMNICDITLNPIFKNKSLQDIKIF